MPLLLPKSGDFLISKVNLLYSIELVGDFLTYVSDRFFWGEGIKGRHTAGSTRTLTDLSGMQHSVWVCRKQYFKTSRVS